MAVYYKFKSARDFASVPIYGNSISVADFKEFLFNSKYKGNVGTDFDLLVSNVQTNEEYADDGMMIPNGTSVVVRRVPGLPRMRIIVPQDTPTGTKENLKDDPKQVNNIMNNNDEDYIFGDDPFATLEIPSVKSSASVESQTHGFDEDEERKIRELVETPAISWNCKTSTPFGSGRGYVPGFHRGSTSGHRFGLLESKKPPEGYVCYRCKVPGHFIQHCPTNGDPNYDVKKLRFPRGIPKSMLVESSDGSYTLPNGTVAVLKPNEAAFDKEVEGLPSTCQLTVIPPELLCPVCKKLMKDAVLTKCCFSSFCDKCIRDCAISSKTCVCGAANLFADDLIPNKTLRQTISRISESSSSSSGGGSVLSAYVQDVESTLPTQQKIQSPTAPTTKKEYCVIIDTPNVKGDVKENTQRDDSVVVQSLENNATSEKLLEPKKNKACAPVVAPSLQKNVVSEKQLEAKIKKACAPMIAPCLEKNVTSEKPLEPKKRKACAPVIDPLAVVAYSQPYAGGTPWDVNGYMTGLPAALPYLGCTPNPFDGPFAGFFPQDPLWAQAYMHQSLAYQSKPLHISENDIPSHVADTYAVKDKLVCSITILLFVSLSCVLVTILPQENFVVIIACFNSIGLAIISIIYSLATIVYWYGRRQNLKFLRR